MRAKKRLLCDVDGVLADFVSAAEHAVYRVLGLHLPEGARDEWDIFRSLASKDRARVYDALHEPGFCLGLTPLPGAVDGIREARRVADVYFVTSPMRGMTWTRERELWLERHFDARTAHVVHTSAKHLCVGDVFVDDKPDTVVAWREHHPRAVGFVWDGRHNRTAPGPRTSSWSDVVDALRGSIT